MRVRLETKASGQDGFRELVLRLDMPAPPWVGLICEGRGWRVEVEQVIFVPESGEYRARCLPIFNSQSEIRSVLRAFEIEGWQQRP